MFVYNLKLNKTTIFKVVLVLVVIVLLVFFCISAYRVFTSTPDLGDSNLISLDSTNVANITANNYTNVLKAVHDDLDTYIGQTIKFTGYIYRATDFRDTEFVLARDMLIENNQTLIVGFLCEYKDAIKFEDRTWVEITGTITKGDYHGEIPVLKIKQIDKITKPKDELVYPPDDFYIPTSALYYDED